MLDDSPGLGAVLGQPAAGQEEVGTVDDVLQDAPVLDKRTTLQIACAYLKNIECDE